MNGTQPQRRTILTEDGELQEMDETAASPSAVFCTNCGTANPATSHFCRGCGQALDEQVIHPASLDNYAPPLQKGKRDAARAERAERPAREPLTPSEVAGRVIVDVVSLIIAGVLTIVFAANNLAGLSVCIIFAWLMVMGFTHGWGEK